MNIERKLRVSAFKDYIAVDEVADNKILSTPFYLKKGEVKKVKYKDQEERKWYLTNVSISPDFETLNCRDIDGLEWKSPFEDLLDKSLIIFLDN